MIAKINEILNLIPSWTIIKLNIHDIDGRSIYKYEGKAGELPTWTKLESEFGTRTIGETWIHNMRIGNEVLEINA